MSYKEVASFCIPTVSQCVLFHTLSLAFHVISFWTLAILTHVFQYLIVVLVSNSLHSCHLKLSILPCAHFPFTYILWWTIYLAFCSFVNWLIFILLNFMSSYIFWTVVLYWTCNCAKTLRQWLVFSLSLCTATVFHWWFGLSIFSPQGSCL